MLESEKNIQRALNEAGNLASELLLESFDTNGKPITVGSITMTSKGKIDRAYQTPYGEITIARHVYQTSKGGKTFCPLEQNARIILSATPFFAKQISSKYAEMGSRCVKEDFFDNHGRNIAHTFVQDISEAVASVALSHEEEWTYSTPKIEEPLSCISVGIDGTCMLTVTDGWREAMVGTVSIYNILGERVHTIYVGATPEYGKDTFLQRMEREINHVKKIFPNVKVLGLADGAKSNWTFLNEHTDMQVLDFYHVTGYLGNVASAAFKAKS
jgi:hypothetical protein